MSVVVDASLALSWTIASQRTLAADALAKTANTQFVAPFIFAFEVRSALLRAERQKKALPRATAAAISFLGQRLVQLEPAPDEQRLHAAVVLARECGLTFYDACYLEMAARLACTLATLDGALLQAAQKKGLAIYDAR